MEEKDDVLARKTHCGKFVLDMNREELLEVIRIYAVTMKTIEAKLERITNFMNGISRG